MAEINVDKGPDLDETSQLLVERLCALDFDIDSVSILIKRCCKQLETLDQAKICIKTKHRLCMSLVTSFFLLLDYGTDDFPELLSYIRITLTCMTLLRQSSVASHILCRALLDRSQVYGHLFNENFDPDLIGEPMLNQDWICDDSVRLSEENLKMTLGHRFRRLPNKTPEKGPLSRSEIVAHQSPNDIKKPSKPSKQSINCYLLVEAFKSSISDIETFGGLFVEFHCNVVFDKNSWPSDEALRVINAKNLSILRRFEQIPPYWDLYELMGEARTLKSCLVLVKALLVAHLALWASATTSSYPDKMISTSRLIPPLAQSGLIPKQFALCVKVFPLFTSNEVFAVLSDIWQYLKDKNSTTKRKLEDKFYFDRLRMFICKHSPEHILSL